MTDTTTIQLIARITLALLLLGSVAVGVYFHGQRAQRQTINAWHVGGAALGEALLIGLAGGWGTW